MQEKPVRMWGKVGESQGRRVKITLASARDGHAQRSVYRANRCSHSVALNADCWPDNLRLSDLEPRLFCRSSGRRGADFRPDFNRNAKGLSAVWAIGSHFKDGPGPWGLLRCGGRGRLGMLDPWQDQAISD